MQIRCARCDQSTEISNTQPQVDCHCVGCGAVLAWDDASTIAHAPDATLAHPSPSAADDDPDATFAHAAQAAAGHDPIVTMGPSSAEAADDAPRPIQALGRFELLELLGTGSFGSVWRARDCELDRLVAVKMPRPGLITDDREGLFLREARAVARLQHPNIVRVHEVGRHQDTVFIVSDYIRGQTLDAWAKSRKVEVRDLVQVCLRVALALHHAHEAGITHRDLKPANILIDESEQPHIMDFGLAKRDAGDATLTVAGQIMGSPAYMSPEQARGDSHRADRRSDVYSLGIVLYELLTGERPFRGNVSMLLKQILDDEPPPPRRLHSLVPRDLDVICLKCLEKTPERRYQSAKELADDLRRWLNDEPIRARPVSRLERCVRWCRRHPAVAGLSALAALFFMTTILVLVNAYFQQRRALRESLLSQAVALRQTEQAGRRSKALDALTLAARIRPGEDLRAEYMRCRELDDLTLAANILIENWAQLRNPLVAPRNGQLLVLGGDVPALYDVRSGQLAERLEACRDLRPPAAMSDDGRWLVAWSTDAGGGAGAIEVWNLETRVRACTLQTGSVPQGPETLAFDSAANRVAVVLHPATTPREAPWIGLFEVETGVLQTRWTVDSAQSIPTLDFSPDGTLLASKVIEQAIAQEPPIPVVKLWSTDSGRMLASSVLDHSPASTGDEHQRGQIDFSPNGQWLAAATAKGALRILSLPELLETNGLGTEQSRTLAAHSESVSAVQFSHDGRVLLTASWDGWVKLWNVANGKLLVGTQGDLFVKEACWTPDGTGIICLTTQGAEAWTYQQPLSRRIQSGNQRAGILSLEFSPSGRWLAWSTNGATVQLLDLEATDAPARSLEASGSLGFSPDDRQLVAVANSGTKIWDLHHETWTAEQQTSSALVYSICSVFFDRQDQPLVLGSQARQDSTLPSKSLQVWSLLDDRQWLDVARSGSTPLDARQVTYCRDAGRLAILDDGQTGTVRLFDLQSGRETYCEALGGAICLACSHDARTLALGQPDGILLVDPRRPLQSARLEPITATPICLGLDPDATLLVAAFRDGTVRLWDVPRRELLAVFHAGEETFQAVALSSSRRWLAAGSTRGEVRLWDLDLLRRELRAVRLDWNAPLAATK